VVASREVAAACDRLVYYAGWTDKFEQVLGNTNPVASPHFNFTVCEPMGVVGVLAGDAAPLLGLISQLAPILAAGNTVVALASESHPTSALLLGEILAVSDLPAGVVNLLTGRRAELVPTFATHAHLRGLDAVVNSAGDRKTLALGAADSVKRVKYRDGASTDWYATDVHESVYAIRDFIEFKTTWHPIGA
jgi:aldehyde dehydrogenase (NAD+)